MKDNLPPKLTIGTAQLNCLEKLSNACAVSGDEGQVRKIILDWAKPYADAITVDALGNVLITRNAKKERALRVMMTAHMDEVGFMLVDDEKNGIFRFDVVGHIDERQIVGKPVWVGKEKLPGVIGACPLHLVDKDDLDRKIPIENLRIDIGPSGAEKVKPGVRAVFATGFRKIGPSIFGKALDNRLGIAILLELLKNAPANIELMIAFTVQEEVGLRGAKVAAYTFNPDLAIVVDSTPAYDLPSWEDMDNERYNTRLGEGPAIYVVDRGTISDPRLVRFFSKIGDDFDIPYQIRQPGGGGTDAGSIHISRMGIPSISVSVPSRYAHTACGLARISDWKNTLSLLHTSLRFISPKVIERE